MKKWLAVGERMPEPSAEVIVCKQGPIYPEFFLAHYDDENFAWIIEINIKVDTRTQIRIEIKVDDEDQWSYFDYPQEFEDE